MAVVIAMRAQVGGQHRFHGSSRLQRGQAGGQHGAGFVAGSADGGFILGEDRARHDRGQHFALGLVLRQHLVADAGVLHIEWNHFAQAEAHHGDGFGSLGGQGIEVEHKDADERVGQNQGDGAGARGNFGQARSEWRR